MTDHDQLLAIRDTINGLRDDFRRFATILDGGTKPDEGLIVRVDRIEQVQSAHKKILWTAFSGAIAGAGMSIWSIVTAAKR